MSYYNGCDGCSDLGQCEAIVKGLEMVNGANNTSTKAVPVGTLQALFDPTNLADASYQEIQGEAGETRKVRVKRIPRGTSADATDDLTCDTTTTAGYVEQVICVTEQASTTFEVSLDELRRYCADTVRVVNGGQGTQTFVDFIRKIEAKMNGLRQKINEKVISLILANAGYNVVTCTNTPIAVPVRQALDGAKVELGIQEIVHAMKRNQVYGQFLAVGSGNFDKFNTSANWGCCNQYGMDWTKLVQGAPYRYYNDDAVEVIGGLSDELLVLAPGAVQFYYVNDTLVGKANQDRRHGTSTYGLIPDPFVPGLMYDLAIDESNCDSGFRAQSWKISLYLQYGVAFIPDNAYGANDPLRCPGGISNGVFLYQATSI